MSTLTANTQLNAYSNYTAQTVVETPVDTSQSDLSKKVAQLKAAANEFANLTIDQRIALAESMKQGYVDIAEASVYAGCKAKGITIGSPQEAEEWATGPWATQRQLRLIIESLRAIQKTGNTPIGKISRNAAGNLAVNVYPNNAIDGMLFKDVSVEVHMLPEVTEQRLEADRASFYKIPHHQGKVALVLGAGNIAAIGVMDVITKMFNEGKVCILKMNPVNAYLGPYIESAFKAAIDQHYFAVVYGGVEIGRHLVYHPDIDEVHLTGSNKTYDQIVWGAPGAERQARMERKEPMLRKPMSAELGNVSPVIVVPGPYTDKEIAFQADAIAAAMTMNASFFCNSAKVLVMPKGWAGSGNFLRAVEKTCGMVEPRKAYYPGAEDRWTTLTKNRRNAVNIGKPAVGALPWTFITGLDANDDEVLFREEAFCSVFAEVQLGSQKPIEFMEKAVNFCNSRLWGNLNATIIVHPRTLKDPTVKAAFEQAICKLKYGTVAINTFPGIAFALASPPWGAHPSSTPEDIQSGNGFVHNTAMLEGIEKAVIRAPLTVSPKPAWLTSHRKANIVTRRIAEMEATASWAKVPGIVWAAMQG